MDGSNTPNLANQDQFIDVVQGPMAQAQDPAAQGPAA